MGTFLVLAVLLVVVAAALRAVVRGHKGGTHCADCAAAGRCPHCAQAPQ